MLGLSLAVPMKTLRGMTLTISLWAIAASLAVSGASATPPEFLTVRDDQNHIEVRVEEESGGWLKIGRVNVDGPYYDGPAGYNVFKICRQPHPTAVLGGVSGAHSGCRGFARSPSEGKRELTSS